MRNWLLLTSVLFVFGASAQADACCWRRARMYRSSCPPRPPCYYYRASPRYAPPPFHQPRPSRPTIIRASSKEEGPYQAPAPAGNAMPDGGPTIPGGVYDSGR
jgi:hypothetical protein